MKICKNLIAFAMLFISLIGYSQSKEQTFHLKNGSIIIGEIIEEERSFYKVKTEDGNTIVFNKHDLTDLNKPEVKILFHSRLEIVGGALYTNNNNGIFGMTGLLGFTVGNQFYLGLALEYQETSQRVHVPMYVDMRLDLFKRKVSPYLFVNTGISHNEWKDRNYTHTYVNHGIWTSDEIVTEEFYLENDTGIFGRGGIGCELKLNEKINLLISAFVSHNTYLSKHEQAESQVPRLFNLDLRKKTDKYFNVVGLKLGIGIN